MQQVFTGCGYAIASVFAVVLCVYTVQYMNSQALSFWDSTFIGKSCSFLNTKLISVFGFDAALPSTGASNLSDGAASTALVVYDAANAAVSNVMASSASVETVSNATASSASVEAISSTSSKSLLSFLDYNVSLVDSDIIIRHVLHEGEGFNKAVYVFVPDWQCWKIFPEFLSTYLQDAVMKGSTVTDPLTSAQVKDFYDLGVVDVVATVAGVK